MIWLWNINIFELSGDDCMLKLFDILLIYFLLYFLLCIKCNICIFSFWLDENNVLYLGLLFIRVYLVIFIYCLGLFGIYNYLKFLLVVFFV